MGRLFRTNQMNVPGPRDVGSFKLPYVIIADEAFPLKGWLMRPYPKASLGPFERVYNYRLSRGRRTIENTFGIIVSRWRIFRGPIYTYVQTAEEIVKACSCLHNWLMDDESAEESYVPPGLIDEVEADGSIEEGSWRSDGMGILQDVNQLGDNRFSVIAGIIRGQFCEYFNTEGDVWWQHLYT